MRIAVSMDEEVLLFIDQYCKENKMTRSGLIALATTQYIKSIETQPLVNEALKQLAKTLIKNPKSFSDADISKLDDYANKIKGQMSWKG